MSEQPKLSPAQEKSLLSGLANTKTRVLEGRPVTNRSLVRLGYAYHAPTFMQYRLTAAGITRAQELREAQLAEQFKLDAAAVEEFRPEGARPIYARDIKPGMRVFDGAFGYREVLDVKTHEEGPYVTTHWTRLWLSTALCDNGAPASSDRTSQPTYIYFVEDTPLKERVDARDLKVGDEIVTRCVFTVVDIADGSLTAISHEGQMVTQTAPEGVRVLRVNEGPTEDPADVDREPWRGGQICGKQTAYGMGAHSERYCARPKALGKRLCAQHNEETGEDITRWAPGNAEGLALVRTIYGWSVFDQYGDLCSSADDRSELEHYYGFTLRWEEDQNTSAEQNGIVSGDGSDSSLAGNQISEVDV
jgi:hypothetical protein